MGFALLTFSDRFTELWTPLQSLADRWLLNRGLAGSSRSKASGLRYVEIRPSCGSRSAMPRVAEAVAPPQPMRVVRVVGAQETVRRTGCVVISGRMADVCAELDRMATLEVAETADESRQLH